MFFFPAFLCSIIEWKREQYSVALSALLGDDLEY